MIIQTTNNFTINVPKTYTTNLEVSGTNIIRWKNPAGFNASWAIQLGETGESQSEIVLLGTATPAGTAGTLAGATNTLYEHPADTPIYAIKYDQIVFERSVTGTIGTASPMTGGTLTIQVDEPVTQFDDTTGSASYAYRTYLRNSVLIATTTESDWISSGGFAFYSLANIRQRIKDKLWNSSYIPNDLMIDNWINEWKDKMTNAAIAVNRDYAVGSIDIGFDAVNGYGTITTADFKQLRRVWVTYDGLNYFQSTKMSPNDYLPTQIFTNTHPYHYWVGDTVLGVKPENGGGTARVLFYRMGTTLVNDTDTLPLPMVGYTDSFVNYGLAQALFKDGKTEVYGVVMGDVNAAKKMFLDELTPRDKSGPEMIKLVETTSGEDGYSPI